MLESSFTLFEAKNQVKFQYLQLVDFFYLFLPIIAIFRTGVFFFFFFFYVDCNDYGIEETYPMAVNNLTLLKSASKKGRVVTTSSLWTQCYKKCLRQMRVILVFLCSILGIQIIAQTVLYFKDSED